MKIKKLSLQKDTLLPLNSAEAMNVAGGLPVSTLPQLVGGCTATDVACPTNRCTAATCATCATCAGQATCATCNQATCATCNQATCQTCNTCNTCHTLNGTCRTDCICPSAMALVNTCTC